MANLNNPTLIQADDIDASESIIRALYRRVLQRNPGPQELSYWIGRCRSLSEVPLVIDAFFECEEFQKKNIKLGHPLGHYYSPINDPRVLDAAKINADRDQKRSIPGVELDFDRMRSVWSDICSAPDIPHFRYSDKNQVYGTGDALVLSGLIFLHGPKRIIEIGSGYSSARMLDTADALKLDVRFTFIEPYPATLLHVLRDEDKKRCRIIESGVQFCDLSMFDELEENDILFIDSSHVMKASSDVNTELFEILPRLKPGVLVHFHDMFWPFEYLADWIFRLGWSWNELYGVRAFLQYNNHFKVEFFNDAFALMCDDAVRQAPERQRQQFLANTGGSLWLKRV